MSAKPAWSWQFSGDAVEQPGRTELGTITPDWALGGSTGAGVRVGILDSGVEATHPALAPAGVQHYVTVGEDGTIEESPHEDVFGHGTACAGVVRSIAPHCEIVSIRILTAAQRGRGEAFLAGLKWAIDAGIPVCNVSVGTTKKEFRQALHDLADRAYFGRTAIVTAANNVPVPTYPSLYSAVLSVAAHGGDGDAYYYNPSPPVEFGARGIDVEVPWLGGGSIVATGNSYAAPRITGLAALVLAKHPDLTVFELKAVLRALAANVDAPA